MNTDLTWGSSVQKKKDKNCMFIEKYVDQDLIFFLLQLTPARSMTDRETSNMTKKNDNIRILVAD